MKIKYILLCILIFTLTACGFQLRGRPSMPASIQRLAIEPDEPYLPLQSAVRELLSYNGVTIVSSAQKPDAILYILSDDYVVSDTSFGADARIREKAYNYIASFKLTTPDGQILIPTQNVNSIRLIEYNPDLALAQTMQAQIVLDENRWEVANKVVTRLSYAPEIPAEKQREFKPPSLEETETP